MDDRFYTPTWMREAAERRCGCRSSENDLAALDFKLDLAQRQYEEAQARHALLWQAAEEKRLLAEQRKAFAAERKEEKRLLAEREEYYRENLAYRKKLAKLSNDQLRKLLQRKIARKKAIDQTKYFTIPPEKVRQSLEKLSYREHVYSGRWLEESFKAVQFPANEYHRERRVFAPPINRLSRDAQHRAWNGYEWEIV